MISGLRGKIVPLQNFLAWPFIKLKISPNAISIMGLLLAIIGGYFVFLQEWLPALIFFILAPTMDLIDGKVARTLKKVSNWGNYFETMIDKMVDFIMLGSFVFVPGLEIASVIALGSSMLSSYAKPRVALIIITDNRATSEMRDFLFSFLLGSLDVTS